MSLIVRISLKDYESGDYKGYLSYWYDFYKRGGASALSIGIGNYTRGYQFLIWCFTKLSIKALYCFKISSGIFDYLLAGAVANFVYKNVKENNKEKSVLAFILLVMSPLVILNSAAWAQCDATYVFFVLMALIALTDEKYFKCVVFLGISFSIKLQTIFIAPFILFYYFYKKKFSILYFAVIPVIMIASTIPAIIEGASPFTIFTDYAAQGDEFNQMALNYPSFWLILNSSQTVDSLEMLKTTAILFTFIILCCFMFYWVYTKVNFSKENIFYMAFITSYSMVLFLPTMHERYGFLYEILALVIIFMNNRTLPLCAGLILLSLYTYGGYLFQYEINLQLAAVFNVIIYIGYVFLLSAEMKKKAINADWL